MLLLLTVTLTPVTELVLSYFLFLLQPQVVSVFLSQTFTNTLKVQKLP